MKPSLLLLLALPLHAFAQSSTFNPRPTTSQSNFNYRVQQQQRNYPERQFQQRVMDKQLQNSANFRRASPQQQQAMLQQTAAQQQRELSRQSPQEIAAAQKLQMEAEQKAAAKYAQLIEGQKRRRQDIPPKDEEEAAVKLRRDMQHLTRLLVENYREVYLPGRMSSALRARMLSAQAQKAWTTAAKALQSKAEWSKQPTILAAHSQALTTLTSELLGYDITLPAPAATPVSTGSFDVPMARGYFEQPVADQLLLSANQADKLAASGQLVAAVKSLNALVAKLNNTDDQKDLQKEVSLSVRSVEKEMERYNARIVIVGNLLQVQQGILKSTDSYLNTESGG